MAAARSSASISTYLTLLRPQRRRVAAVGILGDTPLRRIGRPPKSLLLYRAAPDLVVKGKNFGGGLEVFFKSGQTVFFGIHPDTGHGYSWPRQSPLEVAPAGSPCRHRRNDRRTGRLVQSARRDDIPHLGEVTLSNTPGTRACRVMAPATGRAAMSRGCCRSCEEAPMPSSRQASWSPAQKSAAAIPRCSAA